ncbi:fluoride efflux transporter FluC [Paenibacillus sp. 1P07SE]|uniref:fluoride efflux transporter FluC n=1 Tax=Paenibacillus sp. 1P07SE TaxID=3132209 RepID=UPI0039A45B9A
MKNTGSTLVAIGAGGALGTLFRYLLNVHTLFAAFPIGTVMENLAGSMLLGLLSGWFFHTRAKPWLKAGLGVGFCGGFTTMSTLAADTVLLAQNSSPSMLLLYVGGSLFGGIVLAFCGWTVGYHAGQKAAVRARKAGNA